MAPLSKYLAGIILKHESFGSHLHGIGKTIDFDLEINNFFVAMDVVSEVWSRLDDGCGCQATQIPAMQLQAATQIWKLRVEMAIQ